MLRTALIGVGAMGRGHLENLIRFTNEKEVITLAAICDIRPERLAGEKSDFNLDVGSSDIDFSALKRYTDMDELLEKEQLDLVVLALPTYLHCEATVKCLKKGINVFCEKPMARNAKECETMINTAKECGKQLMIGQCLRFWGEYEYLKHIVESGEFGKPVGAYFYRGGETPIWSYNNWLLKRELGGGALCDQHVHDIDMINYLYGMPKAVSAVGKNLYEGSGYDSVSANYIFDESEKFAANAQDDWAINGFPFAMTFRANFENGTVIMDGGLKACKRGGQIFEPEYDRENAYYKELKYYANCIINGTENTINPPSASLNTIRIMEAETLSADKNGAVVEI